MRVYAAWLRTKRKLTGLHAGSTPVTRAILYLTSVIRSAIIRPTMQIKLSFLDIEPFANRLYGKTWKGKQYEELHAFKVRAASCPDQVVWYCISDRWSGSEEGFMLIAEDGRASYKMMTEQTFGE